MTTLDNSADTYAHAHELHERIETARTATADALDQLRLARPALPSLTQRTLDRLLHDVARRLGDAQRISHPANVGAALLVDSMGDSTEQQPMLDTDAPEPEQTRGA